uniref:Transthyretin-like family protein n=1 Tax=Meloidogyne javanica TaxID=6303 RepID=A0A915MQA9_MELJA
MDEGVTDEEGHFELFNIYHNCNDELTPCLLKISIEIPDDYITQGSKPKKTFNVGTLNLEGKFSGQTRDCFNK